MRLTRRGALKTAVTLPVLGQPVVGGHEHPQTMAESKTAPAAKVFSPEELSALGEWTDLMIPGARAAQVPLLIDGEAARRPAVGARWRDALKWFSTQSGSKAAILERISKENDGSDGAKYFRLLKDTTIDLYYSTREGLRDELGWDANTFLPEFKGCTHPEHQG